MYDVNSQTYESIENTLATDFDEIGLDSNCSYIVVIHGDNNAQMRSTAGSSFSHTYNGKTYSLRYMTITAADDSKMGKASSADLLKSSSKTLIKNCLDTAISAYISSFSKTLGTVASICGLSVSQFGTAQSSTLTLNAGTNWTRVYTQVWNSTYDSWSYGCCVEYARALSYISGLYYSASQNKYVSVPTNSKSTISYSSNYNNTTWRKDKAVYGLLNYTIQYNCVGDVSYEYGGTTKITHVENF